MHDNTKFAGLGNGSVGKSPCYVSKRTWIWVHSTHLKAKHSSCQPVTPVLRELRQADPELIASQPKQNAKWKILSLIRWKAVKEDTCCPPLTYTQTCTGIMQHALYINRKHWSIYTFKHNCPILLKTSKWIFFYTYIQVPGRCGKINQIVPRTIGS